MLIFFSNNHKMLSVLITLSLKYVYTAQFSLCTTWKGGSTRLCAAVKKTRPVTRSTRWTGMKVLAALSVPWATTTARLGFMYLKRTDRSARTRPAEWIRSSGCRPLTAISSVPAERSDQTGVRLENRWSIYLTKRLFNQQIYFTNTKWRQ